MNINKGVNIYQRKCFQEKIKLCKSNYSLEKAHRH